MFFYRVGKSTPWNRRMVLHQILFTLWTPLTWCLHLSIVNSEYSNLQGHSPMTSIYLYVVTIWPLMWWCLHLSTVNSEYCNLQGHSPLTSIYLYVVTIWPLMWWCSHLYCQQWVLQFIRTQFLDPIWPLICWWLQQTHPHSYFRPFREPNLLPYLISHEKKIRYLCFFCYCNLKQFIASLKFQPLHGTCFMMRHI